jgi:hypothetical protein
MDGMAVLRVRRIGSAFVTRMKARSSAVMA